jgi:hypothetical protein
MDQVARRMADFDRKNQLAHRMEDFDRKIQVAHSMPDCDRQVNSAVGSACGVLPAKSSSGTAADPPPGKQSSAGGIVTQAVGGTPGNKAEENSSPDNKLGSKQLESKSSMTRRTPAVQQSSNSTKLTGSVENNMAKLSSSTAHAQGEQRSMRQGGEEDYLVKNVENMDSLVSDLNNFLGKNFIDFSQM